MTATIALNLAAVTVNAVAIALLWVLGSRLQRLAEARAEARLYASQALTDR